jgi:hypothetical protein
MRSCNSLSATFRNPHPPMHSRNLKVCPDGSQIDSLFQKQRPPQSLAHTKAKDRHDILAATRRRTLPPSGLLGPD